EIEGLKKRQKNGSVIVLESTSEGRYATRVVEPQVIESVRTASGIIESSFVAAARQSEIPYSVIDEYVDLFGDRIEFERAVQAGDSFTVEYVERRTIDGELLDPGPIIAASLKSGDKMVGTIRHQGKDGKAYFYDENGKVLGNSFLRYPLQFTRISSVFSE